MFYKFINEVTARHQLGLAKESLEVAEVVGPLRLSEQGLHQVRLSVCHGEVKQIQTRRGGVCGHQGKYQLRLLIEDQFDFVTVSIDDALGQGQSLVIFHLQRVI